MRKLPFEFGTIHFTGIGGIGMSGIAEVMHNLGYSVQGSDMSENANVARLRGLGVSVEIGQKAENLGDASAIVISTAIPQDNPELIAARAKQIPVVRRADMLAELMRLKWCVSVAGTHGKTTTTSMVGAVLDAGHFDPTVINGGIINAYGSNARLGEGDWMVVEADESDGSFVKLPATIAVVTNIDPEHLDFYGDFDGVKQAFRTFVEKVPFYGAIVLCMDHPEVQAMIPHIRDRKILTYGFSHQADVHIKEVAFKDGGAEFSLKISAHVTGEEHEINGLKLPMPGKHNVQNATAAITVGLEMGLSEKELCDAFAGFKGVKRRFTKVGEVGGVSIIDDYGHHPVEVAAVLEAAREAYDGNIFAVVQPHRYSRLESLFEEFCCAFNDADTVVVAPVFSAGEEPIAGIDHKSLAEGLRKHGLKAVYTIESEGELAPLLNGLVERDDVVVCLGAGSISTWANALPDEMSELLKSKEG
ncbi:MAG: UDP-N-acetylmuramate--L-alanine ligase [Sphingomonadales bacterium]|nr:UDP-N-acetylmuramate--L-alanine ligase [Sphingomonadales bacterium]